MSVCVCFEEASVEAQANSDSADPRAAPAEFQTRRSSAVQEIQLRVQSIFSLRSDDPQANTHTHTPSSPSHMIAALSRVLMRRRAAEVNKLMHHQNTPGQLEVKCAASPRADKLAVYT